MSTLVLEPVGSDVERRQSDDAVRTQVWKLLSAVYPGGHLVERRADQRYPYPRLITLQPMRRDGRTPAGSPLTVVGKHLSERGLGFFHPEPLPQRLVVVSLDKGDGRRLSFLLDVHRCRFTPQGWYESGGRFVAAVPNP